MSADLPPVPQSWSDFVMKLIQLVTLLITLVASVAGLWTSHNNGKKLDEHGAVLEKAAEKADAAAVKAEEVKQAVDLIQ